MNLFKARQKRLDLIAGRKLLLADDSLAIQKVIDLTFTDEGMEVTTVGDGQHAWDKLDQLAPDVVLADVFMPGVDGYSLCERIKQNERFGGIPVILLVGSFEPFDEAEARRVGADDVVTKPFQSIRQLVSRVGSLVGRRDGDAEESRRPTSTLGLESHAATAADDFATQPNVTVLVEAPTMIELDASDVPGKSCSTDIDLQTADTMRLPSIDRKLVSEARTDSAVTLDSSSNDEVSSGIHPIGVPRMSDMSNQQTLQPRSADVFNDAFLDLDDFGSPATAAVGDFVLDLEGERSRTTDDSLLHEPYLEDQAQLVTAEVIEAESAELPEAVQTQEDGGWTIVPAALAEEPAESVATSGARATSESGKDVSNLSPEVVDMIARRAVEQLSERVVREIAWEVVPELAELLIKKRLEEQKH